MDFLYENQNLFRMEHMEQYSPMEKNVPNFTVNSLRCMTKQVKLCRYILFQQTCLTQK
jgi:hypothetical protein